MKVLIIDCSIVRQRQLRTVLSGLGQRLENIQGVSDARAVRANANGAFDVIFVHNEASDVDGLLTVRDLRQTGQTGGIVAYGSSPTRQDVLDAIAAGASAFLAYPFSMDDVEKVLAPLSRPLR